MGEVNGVDLGTGNTTKNPSRNARSARKPSRRTPRVTMSEVVERPRGATPRPVIDRLLDKIVIDPETECWLWTGNTWLGYGRIGVGSRTDNSLHMEQVHRVSYEHFVGPIPEALELDHVKERGCVNRHCCCPWHLEPVTHAENMARTDLPGKATRARSEAQTHCKHGHPYDEANTYVNKHGHRICRTCHRERERERYRGVVR